MNHETSGHGTDEIAVLLADRQRIQGWLDRLDRSAGSAPEAVRRRVRGDYERRLAEVVARLGGFTAAISDTLAGVQARHADLERERAGVEEALAEAELRHAVGEYSDGEWEAVARESGDRIDALGRELAALADEAGRLADVLGQVAPPASEPEPEAEPGPEPGDDLAAAELPRAPGDDLEVEASEGQGVTLDAGATGSPEDDLGLGGSGEPIRPPLAEAPRFTPKPGLEPRPRERPAPRTLRFPLPPGPAESSPASPLDEMTFLKAVTLDTGTPARERGGVEGRTPRAARGSGVARTLKCSECGSMNRPTEWYCERCGAELAAV